MKASCVSTCKMQSRAIVLAAGALFLSACISTPKVSTSNLRNQASTADVTASTQKLIGQFVSVRNDIQELVGEANFTLDDDRVFGGETIIVINKSSLPFPLPEGESTEVQVSGTVAQFVRADIEREHSLELDPNLYEKYENKPAIIAQSVVLAPDPGDVTQNPEVYYDKTIAIEGEVDEIIASGFFELDEEKIFGGEDLLVIAVKSGVEVRDDETVVVTGKLRPFVAAEFERDYDLDWDLSMQQKIEAEYSGKPVMVAQEVYSLEP